MGIHYYHRNYYHMFIYDYREIYIYLQYVEQHRGYSELLHLWYLEPRRPAGFPLLCPACSVLDRDSRGSTATSVKWARYWWHTDRPVVINSYMSKSVSVNIHLSFLIKIPVLWWGLLLPVLAVLTHMQWYLSKTRRLHWCIEAAETTYNSPDNDLPTGKAKAVKVLW